MAARDALEHMITPAGLKRLQAELHQLWRVERPRVTQEVADAAALGDRSENAEYIYGKKRLREIDKRLQWLSKRIESLTVVTPQPDPQGKIVFGSIVVAEDEDEVKHRWQIVGSDESDPPAGKISVGSPVARALLGKRADDEAVIRRPKGDLVVVILSVE